jgi:hypothetical protein
MDSKEPCTPSNCLQIVIFHILYEQSWHTLTTDKDFWGWMIPVKGIHCIVIAVQPVNAATEFIIIHVVWHIDFRGYMILLMAIPCVGIWMLGIPTDNGLQIVLYSIKLIADCHIWHSICTKSTYMDY